MAGVYISTLLLLSLGMSYVLAYSYPSYVVMVTIRCNRQTDRCLGAVVAGDHVVTAARCFNKCTNPIVRVFTGLGRSSRNRVTLGDRMRQAEVTIHPDYNSSSNLNDIALIKVNCLSSNIVKLQTVDRCSLFNSATEYSFVDLLNQRTLLEYNVTRARKRDCTREHAGNFSASQMLCFKKSQCSDNAVGLAIRDNILFGLSTFGLRCPLDGEQAYENFASLDVCRYSRWIHSQVSIEGDECDENTGSTTATTLPTSASTAPSTTLPPIAAIPVTAAPNIQVFHGCPRLEAPAHGSIEYTLNIAKFTCNANHRLRGGQLSACLFGVWTPQPPTCEPILCPELENISNGFVQLTGNTVGSAAIYKCSAGYTLGGYQVRRCNEDGNWAGSPPKCHSKLFCDDPGSINCATKAIRGAFIDGSTVTYIPNNNAQLIGATTLTCNNGEWSAPRPQCRIMCSLNFEIPNAQYELIFSEDSPDYIMKITCNDGFSGNLYDEYNCVQGNWSPSPRYAQCVATCPPINLGNTGELITYDAGAIKFALITCHNNYKLVGSPVAQCENGAWLGRIPSCRPL